MTVALIEIAYQGPMHDICSAVFSRIQNLEEDPRTTEVLGLVNILSLQIFWLMFQLSNEVEHLT